LIFLSIIAFVQAIICILFLSIFYHISPTDFYRHHTNNIAIQLTSASDSASLWLCSDTLTGDGVCDMELVEEIPYSVSIKSQKYQTDFFHSQFLKFFGLTSPLYLLLFVLLKQAKKRSKDFVTTDHIRGRRIFSIEDTNVTLSEFGPTRLPLLAGLNFPIAWETVHCLVLGKTGSGKTTLMMQMLDKLRDQKCVIYDKKGDFLQNFYNPDRDLIFNPLDTRCVPWNILGDVNSVFDVESIVDTLIPDTDELGAKQWIDGARIILSSLIHCCFEQGSVDNQSLWDNLNLSVPDMRELFEKYPDRGNAALDILGVAGSKQESGYISEFKKKIGIFRYLALCDGDFSLKKWLQNDEPGWLFVENHQSLKSLLKPILSLVIETVSKEILALSENKDRRIFMFFDELGTLQKLPSIIDFLTEARSRGGALFAGVQDLGKIEKIYGKDLLDTLFNSFSTVAAMKLEGNFTTKYISENLGEREIFEADYSHSMGPEESRDSFSISKKKKKEFAVLPSELSALDPFEAYVKLPHGKLVKGEVLQDFFDAIIPDTELLQLRPETQLAKNKPTTVDEEIITEKEQDEPNQDTTFLDNF
jgi:type IV secretory pathway TraG/TraD family ATPase VirD4